ncbi:MAG TPA: helix-turn-helix transcriptional regulator, partial [Planctomycetaceae bacterium]|nr:helix-turn-helix transcriptional regulator [Planctomycetaceae bacterium]
MIASVSDLCEQQNVTMAELVRRSGLDEARVAAIIMGRWTPSPAERQKIAAVFNLTVDQIAWGHKTPVQ